MTHPEGPYPPDEPVIGLTYPPPSPQPPGTASPYGTDGRGVSAPWDENEYENGFEDGPYEEEPYVAEYPGEYDPYYGRGYDDGSPARQPIFYVFVAIAVLLGAGVIVAIFALVNANDDDDPPVATATQQPDFNVAIVGPRAGDRLETGEDHRVAVQASSTEKITRFELYANDRRVDEVEATEPSTGSIYNAVLEARFPARGEYVLFVRVFSESGASKDSPEVTVTAFEDLDEAPILVKGTVVATVTARLGPGDSFEEAGTLEAGDEVDIVGKSRNGAWLLVETGGDEVWVLRQAIQEEDSLALVPVREVTPTPQATPTPSSTPTPSATPTEDGTAPDFVPVDARFVFSGGGNTALRITIRNDGATYEGALTVGVATTPEGLVSGQQAFGISISSGGTTTVDFDVSGSLPTAADVSVRVDPGNAITETSEDNNQTNFQGVVAPAEPPSLEIASAQRGAGGVVVVVVENNGGPLAAGNVVGVRVAGQTTTSEPLSESLPTGGTLTFTVIAPPTEAVVQVLVNGDSVASAQLPAAEEPSPTAEPTEDG